MNQPVTGPVAPATPPLAQGAYSPIPFRHDPSGVPWTAGGAIAVALSLVAVAVVLVIRRRLGMQLVPAGRRLLQVVESHRLGPRAVLTVVAYKGRHYVLAHGEHGVQRIIGPDDEAVS